MEQIAKIIDVNENIATVEAVRSEACAGCHKSEEGCAVCSIIGSDKTFRTDAVNAAGAKVGDTVKIYTPDSVSLGYAALIFIAPIIIAICFYYAALMLFSASAEIAYICGGAGFVLSVLAVMLISKLKKTPSVTVTEIISQNSGDENQAL
jgi:positive regulator of sigma E activity